jgi:hypothetical protein
MAGIELERDRRPGMLGGDRIAVGLHDNAELAVGPARADDRHVVKADRQRAQGGLLRREQLERLLMGGAMHTHVGDGVEPLADIGVERVEAGDLAAGQSLP